MCFLVYLKPFFAFCPFLKTKQNRGRQKTRTARSGRETPTQDLTGQSRNLHRLRLPEGNAEIRFCVEISIQRPIFFRICYRVFLGKVSETKPILERCLMMLKIVSKSTIIFVQKTIVFNLTISHGRSNFHVHKCEIFFHIKCKSAKIKVT
jgi:hypothetical protein